MVTTHEVIVFWKDEPDVDGGLMATVAIDPNWADKEDDTSIFFYFNTEEEYQEALLNGTEEFTLEENV